MPELNVVDLDTFAREAVAGLQNVEIKPDGTVRARRNGKWNADYFDSITCAEIKKHHAPGEYWIPTAEQVAREQVIRATPNPWKRETFNLTAQLMMQDQDPGLAERFKREAR